MVNIQSPFSVSTLFRKKATLKAKDMERRFFILGAIFALLAVILGAFAAHFLSAHLEPSKVSSFDTGVRYQFYHALALFVVALWQKHSTSSLLRWAGWLFVAGILCFSGSIYLLATRAVSGLDVAWLGPVTPIGGLLFILGWALLVWAGLRSGSLESKGEV